MFHKPVCTKESSVIHLVVNVFVIKNLFTNIETWKQTNKQWRGMQSGSVVGEGMLFENERKSKDTMMSDKMKKASSL